jgi:hypothetical protein
MNDYYEYIEGLCSEHCESWAIQQICDELNKRDNQLAEFKAAMENYMGRSRVFEALEQYRAENS